MFVDLQTAFKTTVKEVCDDDDDNANNKNNDDTHKCGDWSATMEENVRANKSICDMPFCVTFALMKSLDTDRGWEDLAAKADFTFERMQQLKRKETQPDGSATRSLLWELGCLNYKVSDLYDKLQIINRRREMKILQDYIYGGQEGKETAIEKKMSEPLLFTSIPNMSSQIKTSDQKSQGQVVSGFSTSGSEINFNHPSFLDKSKGKVAGSKNYEDKIIFGPQGQSPLSSARAYNELVWPSQETDLNISRSGPTSRHQVLLPSMLMRAENFKDPSCKSLPQSILPSFPMRQAEQLSSGRAEMMSNHCYTKNVISQNIEPNSRQTPSLTMKSQLDTTTSSSRSDNNENIACFSYRELLNATDGFSDSKIIGEGAFGKVYLGTIRQIDCAIKKLHSSTPDDRKKSDQVKSELAALSRYRHENIVTLYGHAQTESELCLVYQYLVSGSLEDRLMRKNNTPSLSWERRLNILVGSCKGLNFLHTLGDLPLIHGDIKSANILLDQYYEPKLGDLGQAKYASSQSSESSGFTHITVAESATKLFGTKAYMSPELICSGSQSIKSDVYALGVVFLEVCSGQQALDQDRDENKFLFDYFNLDICAKHEDLWKEQFQDQTLIDVPDDIFIDVLKLASKCVKKFKKQRPDSVKLLSEVKEIYKQNRDKIREDGDLDSISTSMRIDSRNTIPIYYPSTDIESQHTCPSEQMYDSAQQKNIRLQQHKILSQFQHVIAAKSELNTQSPLKNSMHHLQEGHWAEQCLPVPGEDTIEMRINSSSPNQSFPSNAPIPEAFRLQAAYDSQPERRKIDRLSGLSLREDQLEEKYPSDLSKLQKIGEFEMGQQKSIPCLNAVSQPSYNLPDHFPQADPIKMAQLNIFDDNNFGKIHPTEEDSGSLECDPVKMAFLTSFDNDVYKKSDKEKITASEASLKFERKDNLTQISGQQLPNIHEGLSYNLGTIAYDKSVCAPINTNPGINENEGVGFIQNQESHTTVEKYAMKYSVNHTDDRRPSDDSNIANEWPENSNVVRAAEEKVKPGKQKLNNLFDRFSHLKNIEDADSCDSGNEEKN